MLINDSVTVAVEIPVYLTRDDVAYYRSRGFDLAIDYGCDHWPHRLPPDQEWVSPCPGLQAGGMQGEACARADNHLRVGSGTENPPPTQDVQMRVVRREGLFRGLSSRRPQG
jgi:hypothetical protein